MGVTRVNTNPVSISPSTFACSSSSTLARHRGRSPQLPFFGPTPNACHLILGEKATYGSRTSRSPAGHEEERWLLVAAHPQLFPVSPRTRFRLPQASKKENPQLTVKTATLTAARKDRILLSDYEDGFHAEFPFNEFLCHPSGVEAMLNTKALQSFECLDSNTYRCTLPKIQFMKYEVIPVIDLRVTYVREGCIIEMLSCKFEGSEILKQQNQRFSAFMKNHISWDLKNSEPCLNFDVHLSVTLQIYTKPFTMLPVSAVETPGNIIMQGLVDRLLPLLSQQLIEEYQKWVLERSEFAN